MVPDSFHGCPSRRLLLAPYRCSPGHAALRLHSSIAALVVEPRFRLVDANLTTADRGPRLDGEVAARGLPYTAF
jgi:hypothetical protein